MPISFAAPASSLVARIALPILDLLTMSSNRIIIAIETRIFSTVLKLSCRLPRVITLLGNITGID